MDMDSDEIKVERVLESLEKEKESGEFDGLNTLRDLGLNSLKLPENVDVENLLRSLDQEEEEGGEHPFIFEKEEPLPTRETTTTTTTEEEESQSDEQTHNERTEDSVEKSVDGNDSSNNVINSVLSDNSEQHIEHNDSEHHQTVLEDNINNIQKGDKLEINDTHDIKPHNNNNNKDNNNNDNINNNNNNNSNTTTNNDNNTTNTSTITATILTTNTTDTPLGNKIQRAMTENTPSSSSSSSSSPHLLAQPQPSYSLTLDSYAQSPTTKFLQSKTTTPLNNNSNNSNNNTKPSHTSLSSSLLSPNGSLLHRSNGSNGVYDEEYDPFSFELEGGRPPSDVIFSLDDMYRLRNKIMKQMVAETEIISAENEALHLRYEEEKKGNSKLKIALYEYEQTIAKLLQLNGPIVNFGKDQEKLVEKIESLEDEKKRHLSEIADMENAFKELKGRYDDLKLLNENLKSNENALKETIEKNRQETVLLESRFSILKAHAETKLEAATAQVVKIKEEKAKEIALAQAKIQRLESKLQSVQEQLTAKEKENIELHHICDQVMEIHEKGNS